MALSISGMDMLAQQLAQQGVQRGPEVHPLQGAARAAAMIGGAYMADRASKKRQADMQAAIDAASAEETPGAKMQKLAEMLSQSGDPQMRQMGVQQTIAGFRDAAGAERQDVRDAKAQENRIAIAKIQNEFAVERQAADHTLRRDLAAAQNDLQREMAVENHKRALARLEVTAGHAMARLSQQQAHAASEGAKNRAAARARQGASIAAANQRAALDRETRMEAAKIKAQRTAVEDGRKSQKYRFDLADQMVEADPATLMTTFEPADELLGGGGEKTEVDKSFSKALTSYTRGYLNKVAGENEGSIPVDIAPPATAQVENKDGSVDLRVYDPFEKKWKTIAKRAASKLPGE